MKKSDNVAVLEVASTPYFFGEGAKDFITEVGSVQETDCVVAGYELGSMAHSLDVYTPVSAVADQGDLKIAMAADNGEDATFQVQVCMKAYHTSDPSMVFMACLFDYEIQGYFCPMTLPSPLVNGPATYSFTPSLGAADGNIALSGGRNGSCGFSATLLQLPDGNELVLGDLFTLPNGAGGNLFIKLDSANWEGTYDLTWHMR